MTKIFPSTTIDFNLISDIAKQNLPDILDKLEIICEGHNDKYHANCQIHNGDNPSAWHLRASVDYPINWSCYTQQCHNKYGKSILGLIKGRLSNLNNKPITFRESLNYFCKVCKLNVHNLKVDESQAEKQQFIWQNLSGLESTKFNYGRLTIRRKLSIPSSYYIGRGYSPIILNEFDVGDCNNKDTRFYNRVVVPIYDEDMSLLGCVARRKDESEANKWLNTTGFSRNNQLYNIHKAKSHITKTKVVCLVEGAGDVWRLEEANIHNGLATFGTAISPNQLKKITELGALSIVVLMDNDSAGQKGAEIIKSSLGRLFNLSFPKIRCKDVGEMPVEDIKKELKPLIEGLSYEH